MHLRFKRLDDEEAQKILNEVNPHFDATAFTGNAITVQTQDLSFYPGYQFLEIADHAANPVRTQYVVYKPGDVHVLNWTNEPIYALNEAAPLSLTDDNAPLYVKFFFTYVRGRHGRFLIVETVDDIQWKDDPPPPARKAVNQLLEDVQIMDKGPDGSYRLSARMIFKDSLFKSDVNIKPDGLVSLSNEELLIEDMPVLDDTLGL